MGKERGFWVGRKKVSTSRNLHYCQVCQGGISTGHLLIKNQIRTRVDNCHPPSLSLLGGERPCPVLGHKDVDLISFCIVAFGVLVGWTPPPWYRYQERFGMQQNNRSPPGAPQTASAVSNGISIQWYRCVRNKNQILRKCFPHVLPAKNLHFREISCLSRGCFSYW